MFKFRHKSTPPPKTERDYLTEISEANERGDQEAAERLAAERNAQIAPPPPLPQRNEYPEEGDDFPPGRITRRESLVGGFLVGLVGGAAVMYAEKLDQVAPTGNDMKHFAFQSAQNMADEAMLILKQRELNSRAEHPKDPANAYRYLVGKWAGFLPSLQRIQLPDKTETIEHIAMNALVPVLRKAAHQGAGYLIYAIVEQYPLFIRQSIMHPDASGGEEAFNLTQFIRANYAKDEDARADRDFPDAEALITHLQAIPPSYSMQR